MHEATQSINIVVVMVYLICDFGLTSHCSNVAEGGSRPNCTSLLTIQSSDLCSSSNTQQCFWNTSIRGNVESKPQCKCGMGIEMEDLVS